MKRHEIQTWKNAKVLFSDARLRILDLLKDEALSIARLVDITDLNPGSLHNHIQKLLGAGLVVLVDSTSETKGRGAPEKRYQSVAREIGISESLPPNDYLKLVAAMSKRASKDTSEILFGTKSRARRVDGYLSAEELEEMHATLDELFEKFASTPKNNDEKRTRFYYTIGEIE